MEARELMGNVAAEPKPYTVIEGGAKWTEVYYVCKQCNAEDVFTCLGEETPPVVLNCWNCKAGKEYPAEKLSAQIAQRRGMFQATPEQTADIISRGIDAKAGGREPKVI